MPRIRTLACLLFLAANVAAPAADWPMWRFDANRSAASPHGLPGNLQLHWTREYAPRVQVWDDPLNHDLMQYDRVFEPVVADGRMFLGFNDSDKLVALDTKTGAELWRFYTEGPLRLPPAVSEGRVYATSDDGFLYCVNAADGALIWKFRGGPSAQKVIGNKRVVSAWPARGGCVVRDGNVYFAASIWPFMGTFIYALDAKDGSVKWVNDGTSAQFIKQPHNAPAFAGVAPQGAFVATADLLLVPGGRSVPAAFDRKSGEFRWFHIAEGGKGNGGSFVAANEREFFVHTRDRGARAYELATGEQTSATLDEPVLAPDHIYTASDASHRKADWEAAKAAVARATRDIAKARGILNNPENAQAKAKAKRDLASATKRLNSAKRAVAESKAAWDQGWQGPVIQEMNPERKVLREFNLAAGGDMIRAGSRLYSADDDSVFSINLKAVAKRNPAAPDKPEWSRPAKSIARLLAADDRLFAVTLDGRILCFGEGLVEPQVHRDTKPEIDREKSAADPALADSDEKEGRALFFGVDDADRLKGLLENSSLVIDVVNPFPSQAAKLQDRLDRETGAYGTRIAVHAGDPVSFKAPPWFARLVLIDRKLAGSLSDEATLKAAWRSVRPYGGVLRIEGDAGQVSVIAATARKAGLANAEIEAGSGRILIRKVGALPGASDWTHLYGNVANTVKSDDNLVKPPLGLLWFGGSSNLDVLPRHGHGPSEQVVGGRLFIEGMSSVSARDVYTGEPLWKREFPDLGNYGVYFNETYQDTPLSTAYNQKHIPGASGRGPNYVATADAVHLAIKDACHILDARTGKTIRVIKLPPDSDGSLRQWGYIGVYKNILLGGYGFAHFNQRWAEPAKGGKAKGKKNAPDYAPIEDLSASRGLIAYDRKTGKELWRIDAMHSFLHNGIVAGNGRVYCLDRLPKSAEDLRRRRGFSNDAAYRIAAFDARSGKLLWEEKEAIFGSWLGYSEERDILLQAGAKAKDRTRDEVGEGMTAYSGQTGAVRWSKPDVVYTGPCILHNDLIMTGANSYSDSAGAFSLLDGSPHLIENPLTGEREPWRLTRTYGCNTIVASEHLLTFRSGAAGYYDLDTHSGTANLGGFKSGCTSNLIIADGVLNAPDYTRTCSCSYQNQTSLALVHMPEMEMWTYSRIGADAEAGESLRRVGVNFGAPGDRRSDDGTLWLDSPSVGGESPAVEVVVDGKADYFRRHAAMLSGPGLAWVAASGIEGEVEISILPRTVQTADETKGSGPAAKAKEGPAADKKPAKAAPYRVRLHFTEPEQLAPGDRVFSVNLQGTTALKDFDIRRETGAARKCLVKEFHSVPIADRLTIRLARSGNSPALPILSGVELIREDDAGLRLSR